MAVLVIAEVEGQTEEKYDSMMAALGPVIRRAPGFIAHGAGPSAGGWRTFEVWDSQAHATDFFAAYVHPNLPAGVRPKRTLVDLHSLVLADGARGATGTETTGPAASSREG
jgi:hypothetical protein